MTLCHVHQRFHAVGHGTFFTGLIKSNSGVDFNWVYDCGSKRSTLVHQAVDDMTKWKMWTNIIDMLVVSHFDDDHVNGLEYLLQSCRVKWLVLPYSDWAQRLREVAIGGLKGVSASTAYFQLDPLGWLASRQLAGRVSGILLVRGGFNNNEAPPLDLTPLPLNPVQEGERVARVNVTASEQALLSDLRMGSQNTSSSVKVQVHLHQNPVRADSALMELMFYNAELTSTQLGIIEENALGELVAKKSKIRLNQVKQDIDNTITVLGLHRPNIVLISDWRAKLKACYEKHFGSTGKAKNNISLCLYTGPLPHHYKPEICSIFSQPFSKMVPCLGMTPNFDFSRPAVLCTGDLRLNNAVIQAMKAHFGTRRWNQIGLTQVPHHGSNHSWVKGNASLLAPSYFVHCASGSSKHPHPDVIKDLNGHNVFTACYKSAVTLNYHFRQ